MTKSMALGFTLSAFCQAQSQKPKAGSARERVFHRPSCANSNARMSARALSCVSRHSADVVAPQIDQHDVLRALLLVPLQLLAQAHVFFLGLAARPGARNRMRLRHAALDAH